MAVAANTHGIGNQEVRQRERADREDVGDDDVDTEAVNQDDDEHALPRIDVSPLVRLNLTNRRTGAARRMPPVGPGPSLMPREVVQDRGFDRQAGRGSGLTPNRVSSVSVVSCTTNPSAPTPANAANRLGVMPPSVRRRWPGSARRETGDACSCRR